MKIIVAMDSFKGSVSSLEAGNAVKEGIILADKNIDVNVLPIADGGEGTVDAVLNSTDASKIICYPSNPYNMKTFAYYGIIDDDSIAVIEASKACGITLIDELNPLKASTYGVGEIILDAIDKGIRKFIIGIGGSATNDGGIGMLSALGFQFFDKNKNLVKPHGENLINIKSISSKNVDRRIFECTFNIACDVKNPLYGDNGATYVYGRQKGADYNALKILEEGIINYAKLTASFLGKDYSNVEGAGASGGLGFAFIAYLNATLSSGIDLILNAINIDKYLKDTDYVFTGEGKTDNQSFMGKAICGIAKVSKANNVKKVICLSGTITSDSLCCRDYNIDGCFSILNSICTLDEAMDKVTTLTNIKNTAFNITNLLL